MAGSFRDGEKKDLSGVYSLVEAAAERAQSGARGIVALPFTSNWGQVNVLVLIASQKDFETEYNPYGTVLSAKKVHTLAWADNSYKPTLVMAYRKATNAAAKGEVALDAGAWVLETLYPSDRAFVATVTAGVANGSKKLVITEAGQQLMALESVNVDDLAAQINASLFIRVKTKGADLPTNTAGVNFAGGNNGSAVTAVENAAFLTEVEVDRTAHALALDGVIDEAIHTTTYTWLKRVRDEGFRVDYFRGGAAAWDADLSLGNTVSKVADYRGIHNLDNAADGYTSADIAIYLAAVWAGCPLNRSLTDHVTPFTAVNVKTPLTVGNRIVAKKSGSLLLVMQGGKVLIDEGVNTMTTPAAGERAEFSKMRVSRTVDVISSDTEAFGESFKQSLSNTPEARQAYAANIEDNYFASLVTQQVIRNDADHEYAYAEDPQYHGKGATQPARIDEAYFYAEYWPVDSMEKVYQRFGVQF